MADEDLLASLPLHRTWLDDIVAVALHRPAGIVELDALVLEISRMGRDLGKTPAETATRRINDWTENTRDAARRPKNPLFRRIGPSTWQLLTWPAAPDLIELQHIRFADGAYGRTWDDFVEAAEKSPKWSGMTQRQRLAAFARNLKENGRLQNLLAHYKEPLPFQIDVDLPPRR